MKKLIFIHLLNDFSGSPKVLSQVLDSFQIKGERTVLYTGKNGPGFLSDILSEHKHFYYKRSHNRYLTLTNFIISQVILFFKLLKYMNQDVIIYINTMLPFGAAFAGFIIRKPVIYHVHEISLSPALLKRFLRIIIQLTAQKVIYVSNTVKVSEPFRNKKSCVIYNALPSGHIPERKNIAPHLFGQEFNVLMVGSLKTYKGIFKFLEIAKSLQDNSSIRFTLVLNAEKDEIDYFFKNSSIPCNLNFVPKQKNVLPFYEKASLVVNLSLIDKCIETFGLTILEALSFGIPVIVPPVGGPAEIIENGVEGYLVSSYQINDISKIILDLSKNKNKWNELSLNARNRSLDFTEDKFRAKILETVYS